MRYAHDKVLIAENKEDIVGLLEIFEPDKKTEVTIVVETTRILKGNYNNYMLINTGSHPIRCH